MKNVHKIVLYLAAGALVALILLSLLPTADGSPGRRSKSKGGWGSSSSGGGSRSIFGGGKKKSRMGTLKKAAVIGATAYGGYQLGKLSTRFGGYHHSGEKKFKRSSMNS